jgi:hypothetical protein
MARATPVNRPGASHPSTRILQENRSRMAGPHVSRAVAERCSAWYGSPLADYHSPLASDFVEEGPIDGDILDCPGSGLDAEVVFLEKLTETVAVDQVDRRGAVTGCLLLGIRSERSRSDQQAFVAPAGHRAAEIADGASADAAAIALALEENGEAHQPQPVDAESIDPAVTAFSRYLDAVKVGFAQQPLGESLEGVGLHAHELIEQLLFPRCARPSDIPARARCHRLIVCPSATSAGSRTISRGPAHGVARQ